jgi:hypothetical protein
MAIGFRTPNGGIAASARIVSSGAMSYQTPAASSHRRPAENLNAIRRRRLDNHNASPTRGPIGRQMHNAKLFGEYKDVDIEVSREEFELLTVK